MADQPTITLNDGQTMPQIRLGVFKVPPPDAARLVATAIGARGAERLVVAE